MGKLRSHPNLRSQGRASAAGFVLVVLLSLLAVDSARQAGQLVGPSTNIGVEHMQPMSISFDVGTLSGVAVIDVVSSNKETVYLSVPSDWVEREVRNVPIKEVTSEPASFGYNRWKLPAGAGISFRVASDPGRIILHNPSGISVKASIRRADLDAGGVESNVVLILKGEGEL